MRLLKQALVLAILVCSINSYSQKNRSMTNQDIVTKFLNGFNDPTKIQESFALLADNYQFKNPIVSLNSKIEFIELAKQIGAVVTGIEIINTATNDNWVAVSYNFKSAIPGLESNLATEWFRVEDGLIIQSQLIYDTVGWRKLYFSVGRKE